MQWRLTGIAAMILVWLVAWTGMGAAADPGGSPLLFLRGQELWTADSQGQGQRRLTAAGVVDEWSPPALSPDGTWAVAVGGDFSEETGFGPRLVRIPLQGGTPQSLDLPGVHSVIDPAFSADGRFLVVVGATGVRTTADQMAVGEVSVLRLELATGAIRPVYTVKEVFFDTGSALAAPAPSPDGRLVAIQESGSDVSGGFFVVDAAGKEVFRHPRDPEDYRPYWRPQFNAAGDAVLCYSPPVDIGGHSIMQLVPLKTGSATPLGQGTSPVFVDGGAALVFERPRPGTDPEVTDLWRQELSPGASPRLIIKNGRLPASTPPGEPGR